MQNIAENGIITLNAGDSFFAPLLLNCKSPLEPAQYHVLTKNDTVFLSIMLPKQDFERGLIRKKFTIDDLNDEGNVVITLASNETENLKPGTYYYEIKFLTVRNNVEYVDTVVPRRKFYIL